MIYQYNWLGPNTRWEYRLRIIPAGDTVINRDTEPVKYIPDGVILMQDAEKGNENLLLGMSKTPTLKLKVNLTLIPDETDYDDLYDALYNPLTTANISVSHTNFGISSLDFEKGTVYEIDIKYNGNSETEVFRPFFIGMQNEGLSDLYNESSQSMEIELLDVTRVVYEAIDFQAIDRVTADKVKNYVFDLISSFTHIDGVTSYLILIAHTSLSGTSYTGTWYSFVKRFAFIDFIKQTALGILNKILRTNYSSITLVNTSDAVKFYKQAYTGTGERGNELASDNQYQIAFVSSESSGIHTKSDDSGSSNGYYELNGSQNSIITKYKNAWDYLNDYFEESLVRGFISNGSVRYATLFGSTSEIDISKDDIEEINIKKSVKITSSVKSILTNTIDDDINEYEESSGLSKNKSNYTFPILSNNLPCQLSDYFWTPGYDWSARGSYFSPDLFQEHDAFAALIFRGDEITPSKVNVQNVYYFDTPSFSNYEIAVKTHEQITQQVDWSGTTNEDYFIIDDISYKTSPMDELPSKIQTTSGKPLIQTKTLAKVLLGRIPGISFKVPLWKYTDFTAGGSVGFVWWDYERIKFNFDPAELSSRLSYLPSEWFITNVKIDLQRETAEIEAIARSI